MLIPWSDITARKAETLLFPAIALEFARAPGVSLHIGRGLAQSLFDAAGVQMRMQHAD